MSGLERLMLYQINTFEPTDPVYFYHPLTEIDMSAFEEFDLDEDAYQFINGAIDIIGHARLLAWLRGR